MPSTSSLFESSIPNKSNNRNEILGFQEIPKELLEMKIRDDKNTACHDNKVLYRYIEIVYHENINWFLILVPDACSNPYFTPTDIYVTISNPDMIYGSA